MSPDLFLNILWSGMRDDCSPAAEARAAGAIDAFHATESLNDLEAEAWRRRFNHCPGHGDEGGRVWCAYCGDLEGVRP